MANKKTDTENAQKAESTPKAEAKSQKTKKIYCIATFCGSWGNYEGGRTYDVDAALADEFIKTGFAKEVKGGE